MIFNKNEHFWNRVDVCLSKARNMPSMFMKVTLWAMLILTPFMHEHMLLKWMNNCFTYDFYFMSKLTLSSVVLYSKNTSVLFLTLFIIRGVFHIRRLRFQPNVTHFRRFFLMKFRPILLFFLKLEHIWRRLWLDTGYFE